MAQKGVFLVSLNSKRLVDILNKGYNNTILKNEDLDIFVFDIQEKLNGIFFNSLNINEEHDFLESTIEKVKEHFIELVGNNRILIRFSEISKIIKPYLSKVYFEYYYNNSFQRHCKSQIFQNLQPKLRSVGITNHKSSLVELLSPFLLGEIAYYLYLYDTGKYSKIFGLENEMEILKAIKNKKYEDFVGFLKYDVPHIKVNYSSK